MTRSRLTATGVFQATDLTSGEMILNQTYKRVASYSSNSNRYASDRAKLSAEDKLITSLAQEFATRFVNATKHK